jgi:hypothetical protein
VNQTFFSLTLKTLTAKLCNGCKVPVGDDYNGIMNYRLLWKSGRIQVLVVRSFFEFVCGRRVRCVRGCENFCWGFVFVGTSWFLS